MAATRGGPAEGGGGAPEGGGATAVGRGTTAAAPPSGSAPAASRTVIKTVPGVIVWPSATCRLVIVPATPEGTSSVALSVSISITGWSTVRVSPSLT